LVQAASEFPAVSVGVINRKGASSGEAEWQTPLLTGNVSLNRQQRNARFSFAEDACF